LEEVFLRVADEADEFHGEGARPDKESPVEDVAVAITAKRRRSSVSQTKKPVDEKQLLTKDIDVEPAGGSHLDHFVAIFNRRLLQFSPKRSPANFCFNVLLPIALIILGGWLGSRTQTSSVTSSYPFLQMTPAVALFDRNGPAVSTIYNAGGLIAGTSSLTVKQQSSTAELTATLNAKNSIPSSDSNMESAFSFDSTSAKYGVYVNRQYTHALPVALNYLASNAQPPSGKSAITFTLFSAPLPFKVREVAQGTLTFVSVVALALSFVPGYVVSKAVTERVSKARHLLRVMGMRSWVYWASNFVFDFVYLSLFTLLSIVCAYAFEIQGFGANSKAIFCLSLVFTSMVNVLFCYLLSFFFASGTIAQIVVFTLMLFSSVVGANFFVLFYQLGARITGSTKTTLTAISTALFTICGFIPSFHFVAAPISSSIPPLSFPVTNPNWEKEPLSEPFMRTFAGNSFIYLTVHLIVSSILLYLLESPNLRV
jgi:hypothetical protein